MKSLTRDELLSLLKMAKRHSDKHHLMILVSFWHGLRASETINLTGCDILDGHVSVHRLKGSLATYQPFKSDPNPLLDEATPLAELAKETDADIRLFPMTRKHFYCLIRKYGEMAGIPWRKCHPHALKHTFGRLFIDVLGVPKMQKRLGHKNGNSTLKYTEFAEDEVSAEVAKLSI